MQSFVLIYNVAESAILSLRRFATSDRAYEAFVEAEREFPGTAYVVTMLMAPSLEDLKVTHGNFFSTMDLTWLRQVSGAASS